MTVMFLFLLGETLPIEQRRRKRERRERWWITLTHAQTHTHAAHATAINGNLSLPWTIYSSQWNKLIWAMKCMFVLLLATTNSRTQANSRKCPLVFLRLYIQTYIPHKTSSPNAHTYIHRGIERSRRNRICNAFVTTLVLFFSFSFFRCLLLITGPNIPITWHYLRFKTRHAHKLTSLLPDMPLT